MRTYFVSVILVASWGCALTSPEISETVTISTNVDDPKLGEFFATEKYDPIAAQKADQSSRNLTATTLIDRIVDLAIKRVKEKTTGPIKLSDEVKEFNRKFLLIPIKGEVILYNGLLNGVNTIERAGKTTWESKSGHIFVNTTIEFEQLKFIYDFQSNLYKLSADGACKGEMDKLIVSVGFQLKIVDKEIQLTRLKLITAKTLKLQLDSEKFADKVVNFILKSITSIFKTIILNHLEKELQTYIGTVLHFGAGTLK